MPGNKALLMFGTTPPPAMVASRVSSFDHGPSHSPRFATLRHASPRVATLRAPTTGAPFVGVEASSCGSLGHATCRKAYRKLLRSACKTGHGILIAQVPSKVGLARPGSVRSHRLHETGELFVATDGDLQMPGSNALQVVVLGRHIFGPTVLNCKEHGKRTKGAERAYMSCQLKASQTWAEKRRETHQSDKKCSTA